MWFPRRNVKQAEKLADRSRMESRDVVIRNGKMGFRQGLKLACYDGTVYEVAGDGSFRRLSGRR